MIQTSLQSWRDVQPVLGLKQALVYDALRRLGGLATDRQISTVTTLPRALVAARRKELLDQGLVEPSGEIYDNVTNRTVTTWRIK